MDSRTPRRERANAELPHEVPFAHHVGWHDESEEWRPAIALSWTIDHVKIQFLEVATYPQTARTEWLPAMDVARSMSFLLPPGRTEIFGRKQ